MIKYPLFYRMRIAEYITFSDRIYKLILDAVNETITLEPFKGRINNAKTKLEGSRNKIYTQLLTLSIKDCDARRGQALGALACYAEACSKRFDKVLSEGGSAILNEIKSHGPNITRRPMLEESAIVTGLIKKIKTNEALQKALANIDGTIWLEEVEKTQEDFEAAVSDREGAKLDRSEEQSSEACREVRSEIEAFFKYLDVMCDIDSDPLFKELVKGINIVVEETNAIIAHRIGKSEKGEDDQPSEE